MLFCRIEPSGKGKRSAFQARKCLIYRVFRLTDVPITPFPRGRQPKVGAHAWLSDEARHGKAFEGLLKRYFG